jgi:ubiquinone/menaquinone biosynthesis C-methylase UbiE
VQTVEGKRRWGTGNYAAAADRIALVGEQLIKAVALEPGMELLDVACGTGYATIPAAREGARVTGLDSSRDLLAIARERAADSMVEIEWVVGDVQQLPFESGSFDRVISTFGHMFAPDHERAAAEMRRVCRPGGRVGLAAWTPDGAIGRMLGAGPDPACLSWGTEVHLRELLGEDLELEHHELEWRDPSAENFAAFMLESFKALGEHSEELRSAFVAQLERENLDDDERLRFRAGYVTSVLKL